MDTPWFLDRLRSLGFSQRRLAMLMNMEPGSLNRMIRGTRKIHARELRDLSLHLQVPVETLLQKCLKAEDEDHYRTMTNDASG